MSRHLRDATERVLHPALLLIHVISRGEVEDDVAGKEHGREDADDRYEAHISRGTLIVRRRKALHCRAAAAALRVKGCGAEAGGEFLLLLG